MVARTYSATLLGVNAIEVEIESHEAGGNPKMFIVGLPDASVKESRERVVAAISSSGFLHHDGVITVNLAPADMKKEGPGFDLPIAVSLIAHRCKIPIPVLSESAMIGELALNGELRPVRGLLAVALEARARGRKRLLVPKRAAIEASVVAGIDIIGVSNLREAVDYLKSDIEIAPEPCRASEFFATASSYDIDFCDVKGQNDAKRAIEVAVAGGHNILMLSSLPPRAGSPIQPLLIRGETETARFALTHRIHRLLPPFTKAEKSELARIHKLAGIEMINTRPFRSPHHTISESGLCGGKAVSMPEEVALAHAGALFLDHLTDFKGKALTRLAKIRRRESAPVAARSNGNCACIKFSDTFG